MRPSSTLKFQFVFGVSECLWEIFSLLHFENFWFYIWVVVVYLWLLILWHKWLHVTSYPMPMNKKPEYKDHQCILRNVEEDLLKENLISISSESWKVHLLFNIFCINICFGLNLSKNYLQFGDDFSFLTQTVSPLAVQLYCVDIGISTFSVLGSILAVHICITQITNSFFCESFSHNALVCSVY